MITKKNLQLARKNKKTIVYDVCYKETNSPKPVVIFCHGYKGYKDWGAWNLVAEKFASDGFLFLKFNFSHNGGTVDDPIDFPDLEAFSENNFSKELDDLEDIINRVSSSGFFKSEIDSSNITLIAHSRGGGIILIKASENLKVKNVITWAGVSDYKERFLINSEHFKDWEKTGITYVENSRTKQQMPHKFQFYKDFEFNEERFTIKRAIKNIKSPILIVQGSNDPTVLEAEGRQLHKWNPNSKLLLIKNGDHSFGTKHPWEAKRLPNDLQKVVEKSISFLKETNK
ncbi:MAG: alpha/beta hydrolase [Flavobacteriaceae bacterium]|nr:alpha/beta hydrolase [Flavobacteriaceae bacterium]